MLDSPREVIRCIATYPDWWQTPTTSLMQVGNARRSNELRDGIHPGVIETLDERSELCRRMMHVEERDKNVLFLWYVKQLHVDDIAAEIGVSRRQAFRLRAAAVRKIIDLGEPRNAA
jgi:DNA-directed RNA polymerase specialized sigma subunit